MEMRSVDPPWAQAAIEDDPPDLATPLFWSVAASLGLLAVALYWPAVLPGLAVLPISP